VQTVLAKLYRSAKRFDPLTYLSAAARDTPNMFDIIMNSMQTLQYELGNFKANLGRRPHQPRPLRLHLGSSSYRLQEMIDRGRRSAERALPDSQARAGRRSSHATESIGGGAPRGARPA